MTTEAEPIPEPGPPPAPVSAPAHHPMSVGETLRAIVQLFVLFVTFFLLVRTIFVEPFGVPTGSMAPALYGNHRAAPCPRCGFSISVGSATAEEQRKREFFNPQVDVACPNCGRKGINLTRLTGEISGDRLLVDKTAFQYRGPRRWEVAVFRCPVDDAKPYVKRTVGLPGETIRLFDGDVLANGQILRKTLADLRDLRIPVFDMDYPPEPMGWGFRWRIEPILPESQLPALDPPPVLPKVEDIVQESRLILDGTATPNGFGLTYLHRNVDTREADVIRDPLGYNGGLRRGAPQPVHDFFLECEIEVLAGSGVFSCRLGDGGDTVRVDLPIAPPDQPATALTLLHDGGPEGLTNPNFRLQPGQRVKLEFAFVDRRLLLSLDGKDDVMPPLDLPALPQKRSGTDRPLQLGIRGASVVLHHLRISRDIHYRDDNSNGTGRTYVLGANEYFMMGDNSANSSDSRDWSTFGVARSAFIGKPFLIHQPLKAGRLTANGKEWKMQTVDWDRFRLLN